MGQNCGAAEPFNPAKMAGLMTRYGPHAWRWRRRVDAGP
jgi:hypothetical protein